MIGKPLLSVRLDAEYGGVPALRDVCLELGRGEVLGLVGASGAGKSTLVLSLLGLLPWRGGRVSGEVILDGRNLLQLPERRLRELRGRRIALVPQSPMSALNGAIGIESHFREAWRAHNSDGRDEFSARVRYLLSEVQLPTEPEFLRRRPSQISVGQAQRVLIALALLHGPDLIIADEPTSALDPVTQSQIVDLLSRLNRKHGVAFLYVSHDLVSVLQFAHRIAVLNAGSIVEILPVDEVGKAVHPATIALLNALPVPAEVIIGYCRRQTPHVEKAG
ncbi:MAG TPA: ABC transporter ATP-binding protein [Terracidiphilus sp.]|nr:ABC transporter ATP-binding protein [Terracidiphilus sp.]